MCTAKMSDIWVFSPSSEPLLRECLKYATEDTNEWARRFRKSNISIALPSDIVSTESAELCHEERVIDTKIDTASKTLTNQIDVDFLENLELDPNCNFQLFTQTCISNELLVKSAEQLSDTTIDIICSNVFSNKCEQAFKELFTIHFVYTYIKRKNCRSALDMIIKCQENAYECCQLLLVKILKDTTIPNQLLFDYYSNVGSKQQSDLINIIIENGLSAQEFVHHILMITLMFKNLKNDRFNNIILNNLVICSQICAKDKNYGRLLFEYLKYCLDSNAKIPASLEQAVEIHQSAFRNPSLNIFKKLKEEQIKL